MGCYNSTPLPQVYATVTNDLKGDIVVESWCIGGGADFKEYRLSPQGYCLAAASEQSNEPGELWIRVTTKHHKLAAKRVERDTEWDASRLLLCPCDKCLSSREKDRLTGNPEKLQYC